MPAAPGAERFRRAEEIFQRVLDTPPEGRVQVLASACAGNAALHREVESLLTAFVHADEVLPRVPPPGAERRESGRPAPSVAGFRILRRVGEGGSSEVYLAEATDRARSAPVALKVIRGLSAYGSLLDRFRREALILGGLHHPNISRYFDSGTTEEGLPFFAMDYVDGEAIDVYADHQRLTLRQRIELFRQVCAAVQYAHRNLVVHRDLKPTNILVTAEGVPKLLDFGIAKLLDEEAFPFTVDPTRTGLRPMTPRYASPEQLSGEAITTATDVYSLGVLLFRLLTGCFPHQIADLPPGSIAELIRRQPPRRPSSVAMNSAGGNGGQEAQEPIEALATLRGRTPRQLSRALAGDLDNILLKALHHEPERRYGSPEAFSDDLGRHLAGLPVTARPDTFGYRFSRMVRRNPIASLFAAGLLLITTASAIGFALLSARLASERDLSRERQAVAEEVSDFLVDIFEVTDPNVQRGEEITARQLLARGSERIDRVLHDDPLIHATLQHTIGVANRQLGQTDEAQAHLQAALATRLALLGQMHPDVTSTLFQLALAFKDKGDSAAAEELLRRAIPAAVVSSGEESEEVARLYDTLSQTLLNQGQLDLSERWQRQALEMRTRLFGPDHLAVANSLHGLAHILWERRDPAAEEFQRRALEIRIAHLGADHRSVQESRHNLTLILAERGAFDEAAAIAREYLATQEKLLGPEHPNLSFGLDSAARFAERAGDPLAAEALLQRAIDLRERAHGPFHPHLVALYSNLGSVQRRRGAAAAAEGSLRHSLRIAEGAPQGSPAAVATSRAALASFLDGAGRSAEAEPLFRQSLVARRRLLPPTSPMLLNAHLQLAGCLIRLGRPNEAEAMLRDGYAYFEHLPGSHPQLERQALGQLRQIYQATGRTLRAQQVEALLPPPAADD